MTLRALAAITTLASVVAVVSAQSPQPAQATPPPTEIFLANLDLAAVPPAVGVPMNVTNNPGYDNQPSFVAGGAAMLFSSNRDGKQTDIYRYDIAAKTTTQLTHTAESEYSPLPAPDGRTFSVVRVEGDGTQRLWRFDLDGTHPQLVLDSVKPVGYHAWIDATHVALFILGAQGQPSTLQIADTATGTAAVVATNIGRALQIRPRSRTLTFVSKASTPWMVRELDPATRVVRDLTPVLEGSEDLAWIDRSGAERLLMARGRTLFMWSVASPSWRQVGDLAGVASITRLASRPDGQPALALVGERSGTD